MRRAEPGRVLLAALAALVAGCVSIQLFDGGPKPLVESVVHGESGPKILMLDIEGVIGESSSERGLLGSPRESTVARLREQLDLAREDPEVRALLLRINTPGGSATASDILYREILRFKRERAIPVVAQMMGLATSGGYYVAMAADEVIAHPTTVTGSIGVVFAGINVVGLMEKLGVENQTMTAGPHKDAGSALRRMTPDERAQIQGVLDDLHARFKQVVVAGRRGLDAERVDALADGSIYSASQAMETGLIDRIGDIETAVAAAERRAGISTSRVVVYHRPREWKQNLYAQSPMLPPSLEIDLLPLPWWGEGPAFLYLWAPGLR